MKNSCHFGHFIFHLIKFGNTPVSYTHLPDDTEAMLDDEGELDTHDGLFGIEKAVWEKYHRREAVREESGMPEKEQKYQEVELFDVPALFINERVAGEAVPEGLHLSLIHIFRTGI